MGGDGAPVIQSDDFTILFPNFRPFVTRREGFGLEEKGAGWLARFRNDVKTCGTVEVTVSGSASRNEFIDPDSAGNVWGGLREELEMGKAMDHTMNCGLANLRGIETIGTLAMVDGTGMPDGEVAAKWTKMGIVFGNKNDSDDWQEFVGQRNTLLEQLGRNSDPIRDRAKLIYHALKELCRKKCIEGTIGNIAFTFKSHGCPESDCAPGTPGAGWYGKRSVRILMKFRGWDCRFVRCRRAIGLEGRLIGNLKAL